MQQSDAAGTLSRTTGIYLPLIQADSVTGNNDLREVSMRTGIAVTVAALAIGSALAQEDYTVESLATITESHHARFDPESLRKVGAITHFEVRVTWIEPEKRPPEAPATRYVRYLANCAEGTFAVAGVVLQDEVGRMLKNIIVPPGAWDYAKPLSGSRESEWMKRACE